MDRSRDFLHGKRASYFWEQDVRIWRTRCSSAEAEYVSDLRIIADALWARNFSIKVAIPANAPTVSSDKGAALATVRTDRRNRVYYFAGDPTSKKEVTLECVRGVDNVAGLFAKHAAYYASEHLSPWPLTEVGTPNFLNESSTEVN